MSQGNSRIVYSTGSAGKCPVCGWPQRDCKCSGNRTVDEAVALANDTEYGLNASVWGKDLERAVAIAQRIEAGNVNVNDALATAFASKGTPSGGVKASGVGARHGDQGLLKYTDVQNLAVLKKQVMGPRPGQEYGDYVGSMLSGLKMMRRLGIR